MAILQTQQQAGAVQQQYQQLQHQQQQAVQPEGMPHPAEQAPTRESNMQGGSQAQAFQ